MAAGDNGITSWITDHENIINNIANNLLPVERLVTGFAYLIGITFFFKAIISLKAFGESKAMMSHSGSMKEPLMYLLVGAIFVYFPTGLAIMLNTTFGSSSILQYQAVNTQNRAMNTLFGSDSMVGESLALIIQVIGVVAFVRGWILIAKSSSAGNQPGTMGKGVVHVIGGILAMNIVFTLQVINNTLYGV